MTDERSARSASTLKEDRSARSASTRVTSVTDDVLGTADATALAERIARREVSAVEVAEAAIVRAEAVNARLNALAAEGFDAAVRRAQAPAPGLLSGVPTFIKDTDEVEGLPRTMGSRAFSNRPQPASSPCVKQFQQTGLNILGVSTMPEIGLTATTESVRFGATRNPWHIEHSTGGSSGGAAALVASGVVPIAHANDGGGSIRIPAACCGLVGLKPTQGRVKTIEVPSIAPVNVVHQGVLTRTVRDTARFYRAVEQTHRHEGLPEIGDVQGPSKRRLKMGVFVEDANGVNCDSQCMSVTLRSAELCEALGHTVELIEFPYPGDFAERFMLLWSMTPFFLWYFGKRMFGPDFERGQLEDWARYLKGYGARQLWRVWSMLGYFRSFGQQYERSFGDFDVLVCPTIGTPPPKIGYLDTALDGAKQLERLSRFVPFTAVQNASGAPAISLPLGMSEEGLPLGVQFAAKHGQDRTLLELAFELEQASGWPGMVTEPASNA